MRMIRGPRSKEIRKDFHIHFQFPIPNSPFFKTAFPFLNTNEE